MNRWLLLLLFAYSVRPAAAQTFYYPPAGNATWDTLAPASLGWCTDKLAPLYNYLDATDSKAFIVLKDGKMVLEKYFGTFTKDSFWYWASAGKTLTAATIGIAQAEGKLRLTDTTSRYLHPGWTSATPAQEAAINIRHQLTMSTGLDDGVPDDHCTLPSCLQYLAPPATRWAYHNAPYTLLHRVLDSATGSFTAYFNQKLRAPLGMNGVWIYQNTYDHVYFSTPRSAARFGLFILSKGAWAGTQLLTDTAYFRQMTNTSQALNPSYGYLWWLNGKASFRIPGLQTVFPGPLMPHAPADMICALGKNGQIIDVVPSRGLVVVRMGMESGAREVAITYNDSLWMKLNDVLCSTTAVRPSQAAEGLSVFPQPAKGMLHLSGDFSSTPFRVQLFNAQGRLVLEGDKAMLDVSALPPGVYLLRVVCAKGLFAKRVAIGL